MMKRQLIPVWVGVVLALFGLVPGVEACATCFGASDSDMARGMNMGIFTLLGVLAFVLSILVAFFVFIGVRSARTGELTEEMESDAAMMDRG